MAYQQKSEVFSSAHKSNLNRKKRSKNRSPRRSGGGSEASTGEEFNYLQSLINSKLRVTVVMKDGERLHGHIRYLDRHCFSIGLSATGPRFLLRKENVAYIAEE